MSTDLFPRANSPPSRLSPHEIISCVTLHENWITEAHLEQHMQQPEVKAVLARLGPSVAESPNQTLEEDRLTKNPPNPLTLAVHHAGPR